jgi:hypothetical protein
MDEKIYFNLKVVDALSNNFFLINNASQNIRIRNISREMCSFICSLIYFIKMLGVNVPPQYEVTSSHMMAFHTILRTSKLVHFLKIVFYYYFYHFKACGNRWYR